MCFFLTAGFECFLKLDYIKPKTKEKIITIIKKDFLESMQFIAKKQPNILKMLLLATLMSFFVVGACLVGLPFIVRNILGMNAKMYGIAESLIGFSAILGSMAAGVIIGKFKMDKLFLIVVLIGMCFILSGMIFLFPVGTMTKYTINLIGFCGFQIAVCIFSIFALSYIQQKTPNYLVGKVMSYVAAISMCSQPFSQTIYGILFDKFTKEVYLILVPTGIIIVIIGLLSTPFFAKLES